MAATHYNSASKGSIEIKSMVYEHADRAHAWLLRNEPQRQDEVNGLSMHMTNLLEQGKGPAR